MNNLHLVYPTYRPSSSDVQVLHEHFAYYFKEVDRQVAAQEKRDKQQFFARDWDDGGRKTFASIREEPIDPVCFVVTTVSGRVRRIRWPKQGLHCIPVDTPHVFAVGLPVTFQGQHSSVSRVTDNAIYVTTPLCLRSQDFTLKQKQYIFDPIDAGAEVTNAWNGYLQRDQCDDDWTEAETIFHNLPTQTPFQLPTLEPELWRRVQSKTSIHSARESCGFSVRELQNIPLWILNLLFSIFNIH